MITLEEARRRVGDTVIYTPPGMRLHPYGVGPGERKEEGFIKSVNDAVIFVHYRGDLHAKATNPEDLDWGFQEARDHCGEHARADEFEWGWSPVLDDGALMCKEHGLLAPGWAYDERPEGTS
jgi:hypothetical protein